MPDVDEKHPTDRELLTTYAGREVSVNPDHLRRLRAVADLAASQATGAARREALDEVLALLLKWPRSDVITIVRSLLNEGVQNPDGQENS